MSKVIDLQEYREALEPHRAGQAICLQCAHEWLAVAPCGDVALQCPKCSCFRGTYKGLAWTKDVHFVCDCSPTSMFFRIDTEGPYCINCGERPLVEDDDGPAAS